MISASTAINFSNLDAVNVVTEVAYDDFDGEICEDTIREIRSIYTVNDVETDKRMRLFGEIASLEDSVCSEIAEVCCTFEYCEDALHEIFLRASGQKNQEVA